MKRTLTAEELTALRAVPVRPPMRNRLAIAMAFVQATQIDVAEGAGLTQATISDIVNGKYADLKHSTVDAIAAYFGAQIEDIFPRSREAVAS